MRKYKHRIEVWLRSAVSDGVGGQELGTAIQLGTSWCDIQTIAVNKLTDYGLDESRQAVTIETSYRNDIDYSLPGIYFVYQGVNWIPDQTPRVNLQKRIITITAQSE